MDSLTLTLLSPLVLNGAKRSPPFVLSVAKQSPPFVLSVAKRSRRTRSCPPVSMVQGFLNRVERTGTEEAR